MPIFLLIGPGEPLSTDFKRALKGTSTAAAHHQWIELATFSWGVSGLPDLPFTPTIVTVTRSPIDGLSPVLMKAAAGYPPWTEDAQAVIDFTKGNGVVFERMRLVGAKLTSYQLNANVESFSLTHEYQLETSFNRFEFPAGS
jgi:hypothetical protein